MEAALGEKFVAGIVTAVAIAPICVVCILGPAAIGSLFAGAIGWLGGFGTLATIALMIAAGAFVYRHILQRRTRALPDHEGSAEGRVQKPSHSIQG